MDRSQLVELLPCFVCGDLPPEVMAQVQAAVDADPELAAVVDLLADNNELCRDALVAEAPGGLLLERVEAEAGARGWPLVVGLACAAIFALALLLPNQHAELPSFEDDLVHASAATGDLHLDRVDGWVDADSASELEQAFLAQGLTMPMAMVADLSDLGLRVVGGVAHDQGTVVTYEDADGTRFDCHMTGVLPVGAEAAEVLSAPRDGLPDLQVFDLGVQKAVLWQDGPMMCVLVTRGTRARLVQVARAKVWGA